GTTDNYNTKATERLHIDYTKDAYRATNKKEILQQMTRWLERHKSMAAFDLVLQWRHGEIPKPRLMKSVLNTPLSPGVYLTKNPSMHAMLFHILENWFGAAHFKDALGEFIVNQLQPTSQHQQAACNLNANVLRDLEAVDVWYRIKFVVPNLQVD
ncbi:hypothetical protein F4604DRAFT_1499489, partial [Suillus subluteus]